MIGDDQQRAASGNVFSARDFKALDVFFKNPERRLTEPTRADHLIIRGDLPRESLRRRPAYLLQQSAPAPNILKPDCL
jgi:hypothetical protein